MVHEHRDKGRERRRKEPINVDVHMLRDFVEWKKRELAKERKENLP